MLREALLWPKHKTWLSNRTCCCCPQEYFRQFYPSVRSAKVITDAATGRSKGYGFVRFT
jgi:hypothetical protein